MDYSQALEHFNSGRDASAGFAQQMKELINLKHQSRLNDLRAQLGDELDEANLPTKGEINTEIAEKAIEGTAGGVSGILSVIHSHKLLKNAIQKAKAQREEDLKSRLKLNQRKPEEENVASDTATEDTGASVENQQLLNLSHHNTVDDIQVSNIEDNYSDDEVLRGLQEVLSDPTNADDHLAQLNDADATYARVQELNPDASFEQSETIRGIARRNYGELGREIRREQGIEPETGAQPLENEPEYHSFRDVEDPENLDVRELDEIPQTTDEATEAVQNVGEGGLSDLLPNVPTSVEDALEIGGELAPETEGVSLLVGGIAAGVVSLGTELGDLFRKHHHHHVDLGDTQDQLTNAENAVQPVGSFGQGVGFSFTSSVAPMASEQEIV